LVLGMVFGDGSVIQIYPGLSSIAMATKFGTKWAILWFLLVIFASIGGFSGLGHQTLTTKFYLDFQRNMRQKGYDLVSVKYISKILHLMGGFGGQAVE